MPLNDDALVTESLAGSEAAFEGLVARYERLVFSVAWSYARRRDPSLDIAQEVFVKAYRGLRSYRGPGAFKSWLMRITHNEGRTWVRKNCRHGEALDLEDIDLPSGEPGQERALQIRETRGRLLNEMDKLNPRHRQALTMRYFERASIPEIAECLGCGEGTVRNMLYRSLQKMRDALRSSPLTSSLEWP